MAPDDELLATLGYIVPVRVRDAARARNLDTLVRWLQKSAPTSAVLVVEQDAARRVGPLPGEGAGVTHLLVADDGPFDKGWLINCGARRLDRPLLACGDADVVVARTQLVRAAGLLAEVDVVKPFHRSDVIDLDEHATARFARTLDLEGGQARGAMSRQLTNFAGGLFVTRRDAYLAVAGFPEGFAGWGAEDDAMGIVLETLLRTAELDVPSIHLHHDHAASDAASHSANVAKLLAIAAAAPAELARWNDRRRDGIGDPTRTGDRWVTP